jgi:hypothetical protein
LYHQLTKTLAATGDNTATNKMKNQIIENAINCYNWLTPNSVDSRRSAIKKAIALGFSKEYILKSRSKRRIRQNVNFDNKVTHDLRVQFLKIVKECTFDLSANSSRYNSTGIDWKAFHRPSSNGKGWVLIAPDEPANNWYIECPILFKLLSKKYNG